MRCAQEAELKANAATSRERWTFQLCGQQLEVVATSHGVEARDGASAGALHHSLHIERRGTPAADLRGIPVLDAAAAKSPPAPVPLSAQDRARIAALFRDATRHLLQGELVEAIEKYRAARDLSGDPRVAEENIEGVEQQVRRADRAAERLTAAIAGGLGTARTYAERGLVRIAANDVSRGLKDLDTAANMDSGADIAADRAWGYLLAHRLEEAAGMAGAVLAKEPRFHRAYEIRAWALLLQDRASEAHKDAFSSLVEAPAWTADAFTAARAGYRVLVGYLALRRMAPRAAATEWLARWKPLLGRGAWPDAYLLYLLGELDERDAFDAAERLAAADRGAALAETHVFLALEEFFNRRGEDRKAAMGEHFRTVYAAGRTLAHLIYTRMHTPGEGPFVRRAEPAR